MAYCPWAITATQGANGTVSPSGTTYLSAGYSQTYSINPNTCYSRATVIVDGVSQGVPATYTFDHSYAPNSAFETAYHTITASFALNTYTVTPISGPGGSISPSTPQTVTCGSTKSFTVTPITGYHIASVTGCGGTLAGNTYTTGAITGYCTVTATFAINTYPLNVTKSGTGSGTVTSSPAGITCGTDCDEQFTHGSVVILSAAPDASSSFAGWSGGGCSGTGTCTVAMNANTTITATFNMKPPVADFMCSPTSGTVPFTVSCTDLSTNNPSLWIWTFGDGSTSNLKNPSHTYTGVGSFIVSLTASNNGGSNTATKTNYITASPCPNVAMIPGANYATLQSAYDAAANGAVIQMVGTTFTQSLIAGQDKAVTLQGGYTCDFSSVVDSTSLQGMITIKAGTLTVRDIKLIN